MAKNPIEKMVAQKHAELSVDPLRLRSVVELVDRNRQVHERARKIIDLGNNGKVSPPIVLADSPFEDGQGMAIGFVVLDTEQWNSTTVQTLSANIYNVNSSQLDDIQSDFEDIEKILVTTDNEIDQALLRLMQCSPEMFISWRGLRVSTQAKELDEINVTTRVTALNGFFLARIINLRSNKKRISGRIDEMDATVGQFERATRNPELNPDYASSVEGTLEQIWNLPTFKR